MDLADVFSQFYIFQGCQSNNVYDILRFLQGQVQGNKYPLYPINVQKHLFPENNEAGGGQFQYRDTPENQPKNYVTLGWPVTIHSQKDMDYLNSIMKIYYQRYQDQFAQYSPAPNQMFPISSE